MEPFVKISPTKVKKARLDSGSENDMSKEGAKRESEKIIPNGTGDSPGKHGKEKTKSIKITKISKVIKKQPKTPVKESKKVESSASGSSPGGSQSEESFHGFESVVLSEEQSAKQDALYRILQKLNVEIAGTSRTQDEEMTIDDDHVSDSDSAKDSDQMEIDVQCDKDSNPDSRTKDTDVEQISIINDEDGVDKTETTGVDEAPSIPEAPAKGGAKVAAYCGGCDKEVDDEEEGICCDGQCERWFHLCCSGLSQAEYNELSLDENAKWACTKCSGKPPPVIQAEVKPLLSVRKDLTMPMAQVFAQVSAQDSKTPKRKSIKSDGIGKSRTFDISNPAFLKPFDFGWKRELVYRSTNDSGGKRQGDVYYYTPKGRKLRSLREISEHCKLIGTDLTVDNFTFWKDAIGIDDPDKEIIRDAKYKLVNKDASSPMLKKPATPKVPKTPKVMPKLTATVTPLDNSGVTPVTATTTPKVSASVTPRIVFKGKTGVNTGPKFKVTPSKTVVPGQAQKIVITKDKKKKASSDDEMEIGMLPPTWDPLPKLEKKASGVKRALDVSEGDTVAKKAKLEVSFPTAAASPSAASMQHFMQDINHMYKTLLHSFQYLKVQELLRCSRVCHLWRDIALHKSLWETVRMKNSTVKDWEGFSATLRRVGTRHLDMRKILMPDKPDALRSMWAECAKALSRVNSLVRLDLCRCTPFLLEQIAAVCPQLEYIGAAAIKSSQMNLSNLAACQNLIELKIKSTNGIELTNVSVLANLTKLKQLSLTSVKNTSQVLTVVGKMTQLESLELGDLTNISKSDVAESLVHLTRLRRLRLEKGQSECPTVAILETIAELPSLVQLELINFDVKQGFEDALAKCANIKILLIIPTYVTQSATTNHLVIEGVQKLSKTLNHFVWGLTLELLRVTDLFIDQWDQTHKAGEAKASVGPKKSSGDSIPILKPTNKDGKKAPGKEGAVTQVDVLQLPKLHKVLTTLLPTTKIIILKVPFSATWRQTISGSSQ